MFGMGWPEIGLVMVVGLLVFGPDKLPDMARQAAQWVRTLRQMADNAKADLTREFGDDLANLKDLDPRDAVRRDFFGDKPQSGSMTSAAPPVPRGLLPGEPAPFDSEAT